MKIELKNEILLTMCQSKHVTVEDVEFIVDMGADVNYEDKDDYTPLHLICRYNPNLDIIKYLVNSGADVNSKNVYGSAPIHLICQFNPDLKIIKFLINNWATTKSKNEDGKTPLDLAIIYEVGKKIITYLEDNENKDDYLKTKINKIISKLKIIFKELQEVIVNFNEE